MSEAKSPTPDEHDSAPPTSARTTAAACCLLAALILLQYGLFRQSALDNVVWAYPIGYDQAAYLTQAYETYESIKDKGLLFAMEQGLEIPLESGMLIHLEASLLFLVLGPSRLSALTVNFLHFALLQLVLVWALRSIAKRWSLAYLGLGLLLAASAPFYVYGGLMDFRLDFMALCLFGTFACLLVRTDLFASRTGSLVVGIAGAWCVLARFPTALYVSGIFGLLFGFLCFRWLLYRGAPHALAGRRVLNCALAGSACLLFILPGVYVKRHGIYRHYVEHVKNSENKMRQKEFGSESRKDRLLFYPRSVLNDHVGERCYLLAGASLAIACALGLLGLLRRRGGPGPSTPAQTAPYWRYLSCAALCALWPILALTAYPSPSPVVGSIVVPALVLCTVLLAAWLARAIRPNVPASTAFGLACASVLVLGVGLFNQASELSRRGALAQARPQTEQVSALYDLLYQHSQLSGWSRPRVSIDLLADFVFPLAVTPYVYERHGALFVLQSVLPPDPMFEADDRSAIAMLQDSDLVVLSTRPFPGNSLYPFNRSLARVRPQMIAYCEREMVALRTFRWDGGGGEMTVYAHPTMATHGESGGWITSAGLTLKGSTDVLRKRPIIELRGPNSGAKLMGRLPGAKAELFLPQRAPRLVPIALEGDEEGYRLRVQLPQDLPPHQWAEVRLSFDAFFVPNKIGLNEDDRELVMQAPTAVTCRRPRQVSARP